MPGVSFYHVSCQHIIAEDAVGAVLNNTLNLWQGESTKANGGRV